MNAAVSLIPIERNGTLSEYTGLLPEVMGQVLQATVGLSLVVRRQGVRRATAVAAIEAKPTH